MSDRFPGIQELTISSFYSTEGELTNKMVLLFLKLPTYFFLFLCFFFPCFFFLKKSFKFECLSTEWFRKLMPKIIFPIISSLPNY